jgi:mannose-6-phosphate isomerase-like protein (cupin superfamily)
MTLIQVLKLLVEDADLYIDQIVQEEPFKASISLTDTGEEATIISNKDLKVVSGSEDPDIRITMEAETLDNILNGKADFGALIGRSSYSNIRPINFQLLNPERARTVIEALKTLATFLFTPGRIKAKRLSRDKAGEAHGAHPIPLVYHEGIRFAWYAIDRGETLNEEGERDPYPQVLVITRGQGTLALEDEKLELEPGMAVYIPQNSLHMVAAKEEIEAFWLAWNAPYF